MNILAAPLCRITSRLDSEWRFALGHAHDPKLDHRHGLGYFSYVAKAGYGDGAAAKDFDDTSWRKLEVPHDFAVELPFSKDASHSHGYKTLGPKYPECSIGWYRREFLVDASKLGQRFTLRFDGVYRAARVWLNGFYLGTAPSGHCPFEFDVTEYLNYDERNVIAVRVDASIEEGWYYEGAGIYRHVWLIETTPLHVVTDGVWVKTSPVGDDFAVDVELRLRNAGLDEAHFAVEQQLLDASGTTVAQNRLDELVLGPVTTADHNLALLVQNPSRWTLDVPTLYVAITRIFRDGTLVDEVRTPFGFRTLRFDPDHGFFLNDRHVVLKGTNNHQDHAGLGTALPDAMQEYRLLCLKTMGSNAYRCSHHPPTKELLDACDRLGFLVIDENRSLGTNREQLEQLEAMIRRDRNHPSIILWSLGNEEWGVEGNVLGARLTRTMQAHAKRLDPTRRVTVAVSGAWPAGIPSVVDVMGYNYIKQANTDEHHQQFPHQPGVGTEETTTQGTRGIYVTVEGLGHSAPVMDGTSGGNAEVGWKHYAARPYLAGLFYWTGFDYRGESNPFAFPAVSSQFGILDTCGFPKDWFYYLKAWWTKAPVLHLCPHWNWTGREGEPIEVVAFTNQPRIELFLNGRSLGKRSVEANGHVTWTVPYEPGQVEARTYNPTSSSLTQLVETTGEPTQLELSLDYDGMGADGRRIVVVTVEASDSQGRRVPDAGTLVGFSVLGPARILGVGNGDPSSLEPDQFPLSSSLKPGQDDDDAPCWQRRLFSGKCQLILEASASCAEPVLLHATDPSLAPATLTLRRETMSHCFPQR
jgi:beta-galactosidase